MSRTKEAYPALAVLPVLLFYMTTKDTARETWSVSKVAVWFWGKSQRHWDPGFFFL